MSWLPNRSIDMRVKQLKSTTQTVTGSNQVVVFTATADLCGTPSTSYDSSTGRFTLPDKPCILRAGLAYFKSSGTNAAYYIDVQFYDVTNSQYIGSKGRVFGYRPDIYYASYDLSCDEDAVAVAQNIVVECRIIGKGGSQTLLLDNTVSYSNESRVIIQEMH